MIKSLENFLNNIKTLSTDGAKAIAHPILGTLPGQEYLENRIGWYDSRSGALSSSYLEMAGGMAYGVLTSHFWAGFLIALGGALRVEINAGGFEKGDVRHLSDIKSKPRGSLFLEIPYTLFKGANVLAKTSETILREYLTKYFEMYGKPFFLKK